jgi:DNA transposition AAA+ family ATPase
MTESNKIEMAAEIRELVGIARRIAEFQAERKLSNSEMCRKFADLGSTKTYQNIQAGELEQYDVERQLLNYRAVAAVIESMDGFTEEAEPIYDDLSAVINLRRALLEAFRENGNARVILVEGDSALGKTFALRSMRERFGQRILLVEISDAWGDSVMALLAAILGAFGVKDPPAGRYDRLELCVERLSQTRRCLGFDEAHHLGPATLNTIKTLVNRTPGEFVLLAMPTLWRALERASYEEARQLTRNRLAERIKLKLTHGDITKFLLKRLPGLNGHRDQAAKLLLTRAAQLGNMGFVRDVAKRLHDQRDDNITIEDVANAVAAEEASR